MTFKVSDVQLLTTFIEKKGQFNNDLNPVHDEQIRLNNAEAKKIQKERAIIRKLVITLIPHSHAKIKKMSDSNLGSLLTTCAKQDSFIQSLYCTCTVHVMLRSDPIRSDPENSRRKPRPPTPVFLVSRHCHLTLPHRVTYKPAYLPALPVLPAYSAYSACLPPKTKNQNQKQKKNKKKWTHILARTCYPVFTRITKKSQVAYFRTVIMRKLSVNTYL